MGTIQFDTELSRDWIKSLARDIMKSPSTRVLETEMASRVLLYIDCDIYKWDKARTIAVKVLSNSNISDKSKVLAQSIIALSEMNR